jgi:hypothetical protein
MRQVGKLAGISKEYKSINEKQKREWIPIVSDGLPILLIWDIVNKLRQCNQCNTDVLEQDLKQHFTIRHNDLQVPDTKDLKRTFDYVIPLPGYGHYTWNNLRALFSVFWETIFKNFAQLLGYRTPKALMICKKIPDFHKGWELFIGVFHALGMELIETMIQERVKKGDDQDFINAFTAL